MDNEPIALDYHSGWLEISRETLSIFGENIFKLLILLIFYLAVSIPQEHFHMNFYDTILEASLIKQDPLDLLQALLESNYSNIVTFNISFGLPAIFYLVLLTTKFMIILSFLRIVHEDSSVVSAFFYELKETIYFIIDRAIALIIIYSPVTLLFYLLSKKFSFDQILTAFPGYILLILLAATLLVSYYAIRFGSYIYDLLCQKINYSIPESSEVLKQAKIYIKGNIFSVLGKFLAIATLVFVIQFILSLISFPTTPLVYDISIDRFVTIIFDFFFLQFYLVSFYLIYQIYKNKFEKNLKDTQYTQKIL